MKKYALLVLLCAGVSSMVFPQHVPVTVHAAARKMSVSDAMEKLFERPGQKNDAARMPVVLPKQFQKQNTAAKNLETETFKPGLILIDDTTRVTYIYDDRGLLYITLWEAKQGASWINSQRQTNTYDNAGNRTETIIHEWVNNEWIALYGYEYSYYPNGLVKTEQFAQKAEGGLVNLWHYEYTYDANGNTLTFISKNWANGDWVNTAQTTFSY
ncbi:MAG: hypothetical protein HYV28_03985, partial [Ignavibacteriales bacterium]|nr:hypothetical protein [Ignavibacteriales bacterium]